MNTGEKIKLLRKKLGYSAEYIAESIGVSPSTIYRYENNDIASMKIDNLKMIAKILHTDAMDLLGWYEDDPVTATLDPEKQSFDNHLTASEQSLLNEYRQLNDEGQEIAANQVHVMVASGLYIKSDQSELVEEEA